MTDNVWQLVLTFHQCLATVHSSVFRLCKMIPDTGRCFTGEISNLSMHQIRLLGYHNCYIFASFMDEPPNSLLGKNWNNIYGTERSLIFLSSAMCETYKVDRQQIYTAHISLQTTPVYSSILDHQSYAAIVKLKPPMLFSLQR